MPRVRFITWLAIFAVLLFLELVLIPPSLGINPQLAAETTVISFALGTFGGLFFLVLNRAGKQGEGFLVFVILIFASLLLAVRVVNDSVTTGSMWSLASLAFIAIQAAFTHCAIWLEYMLLWPRAPRQFN